VGTEPYGNFICTATANIDNDTIPDIWRAGYLGVNLNLACISNDIEIPFEINTIYYWQVIARDDQGNRAIGPVWHFTTGTDTTGVNNYPRIPQLVTPYDGEMVALDSIAFSWHCSDPDGDSLTYELYVNLTADFNRFQARGITTTFQASSWMKRAKVQPMLLQIYQLETAYQSEHGRYCLNGVVASYEDNQDGFAPLGVIIDSLDGYWYCMSVNMNTFTCTATANLDDDATIDTWTINESGDLVCTIDDFVLLLTSGTTYYWGISAKDNHGHTTLSPLWTFTANSGN
jgi:hypothetical protein